MTHEPDFQCSMCGVDMFMVPFGTDWEPVRQSYRNCGLDIPEPTCGECVIRHGARVAIIVPAEPDD